MEVLTREELLLRCGGRRKAQAALREGSWKRVLRGTYAPFGTVLDLSVRARAAQRLLPPHALVADRCLLWLLGVDVLPPGPPALEIVVPRGGVVPRRRDVQARQAGVAAQDRIQVDGVRCLSPARASVDLMRRLALPEAVVVADAVQHVGLCPASLLLAELSRHTGLRGVRQVARVLDLSNPLAESPPESRFRLHLELVGLHPIAQYDVFGAGGTWLARVDLAFPEARLALEYDGREVHERSDVFCRDRRRQNALVGAGWTVLRFTAEDLRRPAEVVATVVAALRRAA